jgi:hypothetical protein
MRYLFIALAAILVAFSPTSAVNFSDFRASSETGAIVVTWTTSQENGIKDFVVEKKSQLNGQFSPVDGSSSTITAAGSGSTYRYTDTDLYKTTSSTLFIYRIRAEGYDGSTYYSGTQSVSYNFSGVSGIAKRTWGSIKAMFR